MPDIVIAGGGPAGLAAAIAASESGLEVCVVDPADGPSHIRSEMLAQGAEAIIKRLGLAEMLTHATRLTTVRSIWGAAGLHAHGSVPGLGLHGWGIDRHQLNRTMRSRAKALGVTFVQGRVDRLQHSALGTDVVLSGSASPALRSARYIVDATGRPARIARRQGAKVYHGPALVAALWHSKQVGDPIMSAEAAPEGWWYSVPGTSGTTIGFVTSPDVAKQVARAPAQFLDASQGSLAHIAAPTGVRFVAVVDCRSAVLDRACNDHWLATGDAQAAFDPIASQGLFNALSGGFFAGKAAAEAVVGDPDAPMVYAALAARTAEKTHAATHLQYAMRPFDTPFWHKQIPRPPQQAVSAARAQAMHPNCNTSA